MIPTFRDQITFTQMRGMDQKVDQVLNRLQRHPGMHHLSASILQDLKLALVEAVTNAFRHGGCKRQTPAQVLLKADAKSIILEITERGPGFSLAGQLKKRPEEMATGGRGLWILKSVMDRVSYTKGRPNRLLLERKLTRPKNTEAALELLNRLQVELQALKPIESLHETLLDFVLEFFNAERVSLLNFDEASGRLKVAASRGLSARLKEKIAIVPGEGIAGYVFSTGRSLLIQSQAALKKQGLRSRGKNYASNSFLSVPVMVTPNSLGEETLGVLNLTDRRDGKRFSSQDLKLLQLMTTQAAGLFRVRRLMEQVSQQESARRELQIVAEIQSRLLPEKLPQIKGAFIAGRSELSELGGGDYYDIFKEKNQLLGVMADVSGHNVASALTMASFRSLVRHTIAQHETPGESLQKWRGEMQSELECATHFISSWNFSLNPQGDLVLCGAGHPPVLHYVAKTKKWKEYAAEHLPLGLSDAQKIEELGSKLPRFSDPQGKGLSPSVRSLGGKPPRLRLPRIQNKNVLLKPGDWIFFYTDGLFDPHMRSTQWDEKTFYHWCLQRFKKTPSLKPEALVEDLFQELKHHRRSLKHPDDVAVLAIKKN